MSWPPSPWYLPGYVPHPQQAAYHSQPMSFWYSPPPGMSPVSPLITAPAQAPARSSKYPSINPILAEDTTLLRYDIKEPPSKSIISSTYYPHRPIVAHVKQNKRMRLISKFFPWTIDIDSGSAITVGDVWEALYRGLQEPIVDSEWGFIARDAKLREQIQNAIGKRVAADPMADKRPKRIDFLGDATLFRGLEKDDEFARAMLLPGARAWAETWVLKLIS